ncbi:unnamed protein product [Discosporangium mesarthrocarpum]
MLFDLNGDGYITLTELRVYLTAVYRTLYALRPGLKEMVGVSPEVLGRVTASQAMEVSGASGPKGDPSQGRLSLKQFKSWYLSSNSIDRIHGGSATPNLSGAPSCVQQALAPGFPVPRGAPTCTVGGSFSVAAGPVFEGRRLGEGLGEGRHGTRGERLIRARQLLRLDCFNMDDLLEVFAEVAPQGTLSLPDLWRCTGYVLRLGGVEEGGQSWNEARELVERIHIAFADEEGKADFTAITCGISILCPSSVDDKVLAAFVLCGTDGDSTLSFQETVMYMSSVFRLLEAIGEGDQAGCGAKELAEATASHCFREAGLSHDAKLSAEDFKQFVKQSVGI